MVSVMVATYHKYVLVLTNTGTCMSGGGKYYSVEHLMILVSTMHITLLCSLGSRGRTFTRKRPRFSPVAAESTSGALVLNTYTSFQRFLVPC